MSCPNSSQPQKYILTQKKKKKVCHDQLAKYFSKEKKLVYLSIKEGGTSPYSDINIIFPKKEAL